MFASKPLFFAGAPELRANITNLPSIDADMAETFYDVEPVRHHFRARLRSRLGRLLCRSVYPIVRCVVRSPDCPLRCVQYTGTTMRFHRRLQLNTRIEKTKAVLTDKFFFPDVRTSYVPLVWFDEVRPALLRAGRPP